jgi:hypothetical protein
MGFLNSWFKVVLATIGSVAVLPLFFRISPLFAQSASLLQITSPPDGTIVHPGDKITIVVTPAKGVKFAMVALFMEGAISGDLVRVTPPYVFTITIPAKISARKYQLTADGATSPGHGGSSPPIGLTVEPATPCAKIAVEPYHLELEAVNIPYRLEVTCTFKDGSTMNITDSSEIQYIFFNTSVATVDQHAQVRLVGPGMTTVMAKFRGQMDGTLVEVGKPRR